MRLAQGECTGLQWQEVMDRIYVGAPIEDLKSKLDFPKLRQTILDRIDPGRGELFHRVELGSSEGAPASGIREPFRTLITKVAHVRKGQSIPPHGHSNMVSAFLCISGEFSVRQYDRLDDGKDQMVIRQTSDRASAGEGTWSSISDYRDNVHWLTAKTDDCFLFTCKLINVDDKRPLVGRINLDLHTARHIGSQTLIANKISSQKAAEIYNGSV